MDRIIGFDNRNRDGAKRAPTNGVRVVSRQVVRRCAPSNSRSSGTAALRLRLRPYDRKALLSSPVRGRRSCGKALVEPCEIPTKLSRQA